MLIFQLFFTFLSKHRTIDATLGYFVRIYVDVCIYSPLMSCTYGKMNKDMLQTICK